LAGTPPGDRAGARERPVERGARRGRGEDAQLLEAPDALARLVLHPDEVSVEDALDERRDRVRLGENPRRHDQPEPADLLPPQARELVALDPQGARARRGAEGDGLDPAPSAGPGIQVLAVAGLVVDLGALAGIGGCGSQVREVAADELCDGASQLALRIAGGEVLGAEEQGTTHRKKSPAVPEGAANQDLWLSVVAEGEELKSFIS
jgi:hypothetical protein